jgi:cytoskeleton protein RodZ
MEDFSYPIKLEPLNRAAKPPLMAAHAEVAPKPKKAVLRMKKKAAAKPLGLREIRERNGVTLEHIAEQTRIPRRHLEELERGDIAEWPAGVYARSWARDYAALAGVDSDRVIAIVAPAAAVEPSIEEIKEVTEQRERAAVDGLIPMTPLVQLMRKVAVAAVVLALMVLAVIYLTRGDSRAADPAAPLPVGTAGTTSGSTPAPPPASR